MRMKLRVWPARKSVGPASAERSVTGIRLADAPCSFGAFGITVGLLPNVPGPVEVLEAIAAAGYEGTELGPPGYLGHGALLRDRLERLGLSLAGGYIPIHLSEPARWEEDLVGMAGTLDLFGAADGAEARPVLADAGSPARLANPGRGAEDADLGFDTDGWCRLAEGVRRARWSSHVRAASSRRSTTTRACTSTRPGRSSAFSSSPTLGSSSIPATLPSAGATRPRPCATGG